jgi:uncharacterized membrane protein
MCPDHVHESRSGKVYCSGCQDRRKADRKGKHRKHHGDEADAGGSSLEDLAGAPAMAEGEEEEAEARVLGKREEIQPWQLCLYPAVVALLFAITLMVIPSFRRIPLGGTSYLATPYVLVLIPLIASFWGVYGIINIEFYKQRHRCMAGLGMAVLSMVLFVVAVATDPATQQEVDSAEEQNRRQIMNEEQLDGWRDNVLDKYN